MNHHNLSRSIPHKPILFIDFDQTMTNGDDLIKDLIDTVYQMAFERGFDRQKVNLIGNQIRSNGKYGIFNLILSLCDGNIDQFNSFCEELFKRIDYGSIHKDDQLFNVMKEASSVFDLYILTNNHRIHVDLGLKKLFGIGIDEIDFIKSFDILETFQNGKFWPKQAPGSFEMACRRVGARFDECTVIDDSQKNLNFAKETGMRTILVNDHNLSQILKKLINEKNES